MMRGVKEILLEYDKAVAVGKRTALATLIHVQGSSYRRPGARMLVDDEGAITGAISGGCLEGDALKKALLVIAKQETKLVCYDTSKEADMAIGIQLGCEGIIHVLFEPINPLSEQNPIELLRKATQYPASVVVTCFDLEHPQFKQAGTCILFEGNECSSSPNAASILTDIKEDIQKTFNLQTSQFIQYQKDYDNLNTFMEYIAAPIHLTIVGAGNDAIPLAKISHILGWNTTVVDGRDSYANPNRFEASCQVMVLKPEEILDKIIIDKNSAFVLVTHNYNYDKSILKHLLPLDPPYIGMLGPKKKLNRILNDLKNEGMIITDEMLKKVFGPTGLDIGSETPEEIALSILAEIQSVLNGGNTSSLRDKDTAIHLNLKNHFVQKII